MDTTMKLNQFIKKNTDIITAVLLLTIIFIIIIPVPEIILDLLLAINISFSVLIFLLTVFSKDTLSMSSFPSLLLITTMFRLGLNISSTRLILSGGTAGNIISAFGQFATRGNYVVGGIIFVIIMIVQFIVITNGAGRVAEVTARFTLDAMPGKQMSIDADLNAGVITEQQANKRRKDLQQEAEFHGAMDGASKFVKGDAIAGILIVLINFIGGVIIGSMSGTSAMDALSQYGMLTIGDGLVSQIPALLISVASGILITKSSTDQNLGENISTQLFSSSRVLYIVSAVIAFISLLPGMPMFVLIPLAGLIGGVAFVLSEEEKTRPKEIDSSGNTMEIVEQTEEEKVKSTTQQMIDSAKVEMFEVEIGLGLISLASNANGKDLFDRILTIRKQIAQELGLIIKPIRLKDSIYMEQNTYQLSIKGNKIAEGVIYPDEYLVMNPEGDEIVIPGKPVVEPVFNLKAKWIPANKKSEAEMLGYTVIDDVTVLITHIKETIKQYAHELITNQEVKTIIDAVKSENSVVVDELIPNILSISELSRILKNLLKEFVPINDMITILETLSEYGTTTKDIELLTEYVRASLSRTIVKSHLSPSRVLDVITLHPEIERMIAENSTKSFLGTYAMIDPNINNKILNSINHFVEKAYLEQRTPVIVTSPKIRYVFRKLIEIPFPRLAVLSLNEIPNDIHIEVLGMVKVNDN